ncbi:MAG: hypothetical protein Q8P60_16135 [Pseudorhodobacter sp.]|nr:hypothetical protein [Pseudorhodobacter sp.]
MDAKRRIALSAALLAVGLGAGYVVQNRAARPQAQLIIADAHVPTAITSLVARADTVVDVPAVAPMLPVRAMDPVAIAATVTPPVPPVPEQAEAACAVRLFLSTQPQAMLGLSALAPCRPNERVVLRHGGLAITAKTSATGSLFLALPAMDRAGVVKVQFADGVTAEAQLELPELIGLRRFAVQWLADDAFQVHAFEGAADYGASDHIWAGSPHLPMAGQIAKGGFLIKLGDDQVDLPMLAEVYTYPASLGTPVQLVVEAAVTTRSCDRELLAETLTSMGGAVVVTDLTLAMPDCGAIGDILVLKNPAPDMKIAAK